MSERSLPDWLPLETDEQVLLRTAPSSNLVLAGLLVGFVLLLATSLGVGFLTSLATGRVVSGVMLAVIVGMLLAAYGIRASREYVLTDECVYVGRGLTGKRPTSVALTDIQDIRLRQSTWQRLLSLGTVQFVTADGESLAFHFLENPEFVATQARRLRERATTDGSSE